MTTIKKKRNNNKPSKTETHCSESVIITVLIRHIARVYNNNIIYTFRKIVLKPLGVKCTSYTRVRACVRKSCYSSAVRGSHSSVGRIIFYTTLRRNR